MKYLPVIVVFVLCSFALHAIPKQADKASGNQQAAKDSTTHPASTQPSLAGPSPKPEQNGSDSKTEKPTFCEQLAAPVIANWPLIAVAIWGILVARQTLNAIKWQAEETAKATKTMEKNTAAFIESQRPILATYPNGNPFIDLMNEKTPRVQLALANKGPTTAYECVYESWIEMLPIPPPVMDFTDKADHVKVAERFSLAPNADPIVINIPFRNGLTADDRRDLGQARRSAYIRLRVTFRDAFSPERYADFGYWVMNKGLGILPKYHNSN
jgi:hypothetical protein